MAWVGLVDMEIQNAPVGYYEEEKITGNDFRISVMAELTIQNPDADELGNTLNYETVYQVVREVMAERMDLIETAAHRIYNKLINRNPGINQVEIKIRKYKPMQLQIGGDSLVIMRFPDKTPAN